MVLGGESQDGRPLGLPPNVKALIEGILPIKAEAATAYVSSSRQPLELRQVQGENGMLLYVSLGCDGVFVVGLEVGEDSPEVPDSPRAEEHHDDESWRNFVVDLGSDDEDGKVKDRHVSREEGNTGTPREVGPTWQQSNSSPPTPFSSPAPAGERGMVWPRFLEGPHRLGKKNGPVGGRMQTMGDYNVGRAA